MDYEKTSIYKFLINNDKFEELKVRLNKFNPFKVLRLEDHEIRHSNVLAWLFNPSANHNLGDKILKKFLLSVALRSDNEEILEESIHLLDLQQAKLNDAEVFREEEHIDILIVAKESRFVIVIENKIYCQETPGQLNKYIGCIQKKYPKPNYTLFPIFLTLSGDKPTSLKYCTASYSDVINIIELNLNLYNDRITTEVYNFIQFYLEILKEKVIVDEQLSKLCSEIYKENKEAIELICKIGKGIDIESAIENFQEKYDHVEKIWSNKSQFWFLLPEFKKSKK